MRSSFLSVDDRASMLVASSQGGLSHAELRAMVRPRLLLGDALPVAGMRIVVLVHNRTEAKPTGHAVLV